MPKLNSIKKASKEKETSMIGTFISLGGLLAVIVITYFVLFGLFMARL
ncbi:cytochrome c oxidase subunit 2A [Bacillus sp. FJAT-18017]|nr:cytochrome c oxidase subunit 2A [Bacillus sp. FJAT-18017]